MALMQIEQLSVPGRLLPLSFSLAAGQMLGIIGPNGAGKSTLLQCLAGIQDYRGQIHYQGAPLSQLKPRQRAQQLGYLPQAQHSAWDLRVEDVVSLGRLPWGDEDAAAIDSALQQTAVGQWRQRPVAQLSGGEQARVWLARVLAGQPQVVLADEPIASLDLLHQGKVMQLLREHANAQRATILSIHDLSLAARYCDQLCLLAGGRLLAFGSPASVLSADNLRAAFGVEVHVDLNHQPPLIVPK
ncbi:ABC transporter ATP-binding protein [Pseudomonas sp. 5P_3.1_Bac2]|uniref:ABC transporter ATP-binding protein n=1 Tax=Pseudomonas sp. 5P_3.1_Bac2 TaxID=2971617 RepID=UPI0021C78B27|nr:ABC transporter ATP-binding protein [Pseudomonas sp. 5P_3.1_Bac2]MCU1719352.1 ABC transporter ATP-binding protein [Pseudomonas sp. 5P_3.1_Bac2]